MKNKKILILANLDIGLYKFRKALIQELLNHGNEVYVSLPNGKLVKNLQEMGCRFVETSVDRRGMNPVTDFTLLIKYRQILRKIKPDLVITYTIKPNIYGGMMARIQKIPYAINITGLGTAFQTENFVKKMVIFLYKMSCKKAKTVFFENEGNQRVFLKHRIITRNQTCLLPGAGVDLEEYDLTEYPKDSKKIRFLFIGRIMKEKGVDELFKAAVNIKKIYPNIFFDIVGPMEDDYKNRIDSLVENGILYYYGYQENVKPFIEKSHCFVLPSYHEGMANTLLEAGAMGRPLITSRIHGCMEAVEDGKNGYLVNIRDAKDLELKLKDFIETEYKTKKRMGQASRKRMETVFDKKIVVRKTMEGLSLK
ncbi:glycosyl transferase [Anaerostipes sp. 494a]|uniref:glycosyltransferase family 4 protein n=1 Tax=Anaerostipes sp. 494a TaxID=1261636 RepID=UPI0009526D38|nr:glycosyltransferase family 4 protein [Anaerostipes sp. 494a]OLR59209.1 glycosyl transferase [Anaerostipes sp. 494a]